jgi:vacuolar protein-sorting-associated protein 4
MTWMDIEGDMLLEPRITKTHFIRALKTTKPSVNKEDVERHASWTQEFGQEG